MRKRQGRNQALVSQGPAQPRARTGAQPGAQTERPSLANFIGFAQAAGQMGLPKQQVQGLLNRRYGQQQGYGQGYVAPRRQVGGQHLATQQRVGGRGYNPRTAAQMYGGRPSGYQPQYGGGYGQGFLPMNQMQAMTRYANAPQTYMQRPWGGNQAVQRYPAQYQQQGYGNPWGWY
jgi:hypothetical protein